MADLDHDTALADAHLPALVCALVHITGDASLLKPEWRPRYTPFNRADIGVSDEEVANIHAAARRILGDYQRKPYPLAPLPAQTVRKMMDFVTGVDIPESYAAFVSDELAIAASTKDPQWGAPKLKAAAAKMKVIVVGAGMSGLLTGIRLRQAGIPFEIIEKNADVGGTWLENTYPGCRVDNPNHMYSYSFEPNHDWPQHFSTQPVLLEYFHGIADQYDLRRTSASRPRWRRPRSTSAPPNGTCRATDEGRQRRARRGQCGRHRRGPAQPPALSRHRGHATVSRAEPSIPPSWRHDVDLKGKRVAVIGTGATRLSVRARDRAEVTRT